MNLLISFPDQGQSFAYGVEFGRLLEKIERGDDPVHNNGFPIRVENQGLLSKTCSKYGYIATFGELYLDGWVDFLGIRKTISDN